MSRNFRDAIVLFFAPIGLIIKGWTREVDRLDNARDTSTRLKAMKPARQGYGAGAGAAVPRAWEMTTPPAPRQTSITQNRLAALEGYYRTSASTAQTSR